MIVFFLRALDRRLALLARELEALVSGSGGPVGETDAAAKELLGAVEALGSELAAAEAGPDARWTDVKKQLEVSWRRLRQSFEELALAGGKRHRTDSRLGGQLPKW